MIITCAIIFIFILGAIFGSFLNVVIYRLPKGESILFPSSHCPYCGKPIQYYDNIPIISYALLMGKCRSCGSHISVRYPIIEFATACIALILFLKYGISMIFFKEFCLASILLTAMMIDYEFMIIPDTLTITGSIIAFSIALIEGKVALIHCITGAMVGGAIMIGMYYLGKMLFNREGVGFGDVKLAIVIGMFIGPLWCLVSLVLSIIFGGLWGILYLLLDKKIIGKEIPFGPFIAIGGFFVLFFPGGLLYLIDRYLSMW
jgi:leader peptidase (prepilin peptidase) / N-methyltransferase